MRVYTIETEDRKFFNNPTSTTRIYTSKKLRDRVLKDPWHKDYVSRNGLVLVPHTYELVEVEE